MYGIFINAIKDYMIHNFGIEVWNQVCQQIQLEEDFFINAEFYPENVVEDIVKAIVTLQNRAFPELFFEIGHWWALHSIPTLYLGVLHKGQEAFKKFVLDFPTFINRLTLIYPNLSYTEFKSRQLAPDAVLFLHAPYKFKDPEFTRGVLVGFGDLFEAQFELTLMQAMDANHVYNEYKITFSV